MGKYRLVLDDRDRSDLFRKAVSVVKEVYPSDPLCAELYFEGAPTKLYVDLYLPVRKIAIEVQGEQHFKYVRHMHSNKLKFLEAKRRDAMKKDLLELNSIVLLYFNYNERSEWKKILIEAFQKR